MDEMISCCGVVCSKCQYYPTTCKGCKAIEGQAFWLQYTGEKVCDIYECCINTRKLNHCGKCTKLPCKRYNGSDPTKSQEENEADYIKQLAQLKSMD